MGLYKGQFYMVNSKAREIMFFKKYKSTFRYSRRVKITKELGIRFLALPRYQDYLIADMTKVSMYFLIIETGSCGYAPILPEKKRKRFRGSSSYRNFILCLMNYGRKRRSGLKAYSVYRFDIYEIKKQDNDVANRSQMIHSCSRLPYHVVYKKSLQHRDLVIRRNVPSWSVNAHGNLVVITDMGKIVVMSLLNPNTEPYSLDPKEKYAWYRLIPHSTLWFEKRGTLFLSFSKMGKRKTQMMEIQLRCAGYRTLERIQDIQAVCRGVKGTVPGSVFRMSVIPGTNKLFAICLDSYKYHLKSVFMFQIIDELNT
ncbi:uncharacterized protein LOC135493997 [Lineus longissimus]|uniref:uncharacterized protein LOC135493997 n=1 Tax=Lineus longissimus TaxID=88925 RepID=UPI002B4E00D6